jgi:diadenylate cyclase
VNNPQELFSHLDLASVLDIVLVALIFYGLFYLMQGTRAVQLLRGILFLALVVILASNLLHLTAFTWLIRNSLPALLVAIPVIFQPELRRALERLGRPGTLLTTRRGSSAAQVISIVSRAAGQLAARKMGALIVLEGETGLQEYVENGVRLDARLSVDLLLTIFHKNTALHDGAVIVRDDRIISASSMLPLTENPAVDRTLGTRHRAAVGVTEGTDAVVVVVSEETGEISLAHGSRLTRYLSEGELNRMLTALYHRPGA